MSEQARRNPYVGPRAFRPGETLYGRDRESDELLDTLLAERLVILHAPSGAGKTSLLQASMLKRLSAEGFTVLPIARVKWRPAAPVQSATSFNPYMWSAMLDLSRDPKTEPGANIDTYASLHASNDTDLDDFLTRDCGIKAEALQVLIFDQFEELLTLNANDIDGKHEFCRELGRVLRARSRFAVFSMREDYVGALEPYLGHFSTRLAARYRLDFLTPNAAKDAIQLPAAPLVKYEERAVTKLVDDLRRVQVQVAAGKTEERPGAFVEPVHLQVVCTRLWNGLKDGQTTITVADVEKLGNVDRALRGYIDESVARAAEGGTSKEADIRYWIENHLIVNRLRAQSLMGAERDCGVSEASVGVLENTYVIRRDDRRGAVWYELAHDRLVVPVLTANDEWQDARGDWLETKAIRWREGGRDPAYLLKLRKIVRVRRSLRGMSAPQRLRIDDYLRSSRNAWLIKLAVPILSIGVLFIIGMLSDSAETRRANRALVAARDSVEGLLVVNSGQSDSLRALVDSLTNVSTRYIYQQAWGLDSGSSAQTVRRSIQADVALQSLIVGTTPEQRERVVVRYYEKRRDKQRIEFALRELGYEVDVRQALARPDQQTNSVAYGPSVPLRDLKLIALTLVRGGTALRSICPLRDPGDRLSVAEVNYSARAASQPVLDLATINGLTGQRPQVNCPTATASRPIDRVR